MMLFFALMRVAPSPCRTSSCILGGCRVVRAFIFCQEPVVSLVDAVEGPSVEVTRRRLRWMPVFEGVTWRRILSLISCHGLELLLLLLLLDLELGSFQIRVQRLHERR